MVPSHLTALSVPEWSSDRSVLVAPHKDQESSRGHPDSLNQTLNRDQQRLQAAPAETLVCIRWGPVEQGYGQSLTSLVLSLTALAAGAQADGDEPYK